MLFEQLGLCVKVGAVKLGEAERRVKGGCTWMDPYITEVFTHTG